MKLTLQNDLKCIFKNKKIRNSQRFLLGVDSSNTIQVVLYLKKSGGCSDIPGISSKTITKAYNKIVELQLSPKLGLFVHDEFYKHLNTINYRLTHEVLLNEII